MSFDWFHSELAFSNLGGRGPDTNAPEAIRYVNVARAITAAGETVYLDLSVVAMGAYEPFSPSSNGMNGRFARINFRADTCSDLRVYVRPSCAQAASCGRDGSAVQAVAFSCCL